MDEDFLPTDALLNLVSNHRTEAPVEIIVGAKGSGKTFTYLRMCRQKSWENFGQAVGVEGIELHAPLVPVLASQNLADELRAEVEQVQVSSASRIIGAAPASFLSVRELVIEALDKEMNEGRMAENLADLPGASNWSGCHAGNRRRETGGSRAESASSLCNRRSGRSIPRIQQQ